MIENKQKMMGKVHEFNKRYSDYFKGNINDEEMTEHVSQPFWHSLHMSKKRLDENGLHMEIDIKNVYEKTNRVAVMNPRMEQVNYEDGERISAGEFKQEVRVMKKIKKDNKVLFKTKDREISLTNVIRVRGNGQYAVCPRCGHESTIASYIDGCDYCHSKFKVSDFNEKISGFSIEPDGKRKVYSICIKAFLAFGILVGAIALSFFLIFILASFGAIFGIQSNVFEAVIIFFALGYTAVKALMPAFIGIGIAILIIMLLMAIRYKNERIEKNEILRLIEGNVPGFSANDFAQNLEYKLRNIHFADRAEEVQPFAMLNMQSVIPNYKNVIECFMHKVRFLAFNADENYYYIRLEVILRLTRLNGNKAKTENEKLYLTLSRKKNIQEKNIGDILEFTCDKCGSGIDMFKGGICDYCGEHIDYSNHDWMIETYYSNVDEKSVFNSNERVIFGTKKYTEYYKKARLQVIGVLVGSALIICTVVGIKNRDSVYALMHIKEFSKISQKEFKELPTLKDTWYGEDIKEIKKNTEKFEKTIIYEDNGDFEYLASEYAEMLEEEYGYDTFVDRSTLVALAKYTKFDEKIGAYYVVSIQLKDGKIVLSYEIYNSRGDYLEEVEDIY